MSYPVRKINFKANQDYALNGHKLKVVVKKKQKKQRKNPVLFIVAASLLFLYGFYICPYNYNNYVFPLFAAKVLNRNLQIDSTKYVNPTIDYLYNSRLLGQNLLAKTQNAKQITDLKIINELTLTKQKLLDLFKLYPNLKPAVYVWEYSSGSGLEIDSDIIYPSASIIKIPIAFELMRLLDRTSKTPSPVSLNDRMLFTEFFRTSGSGDLQKTKSNVYYTLDYLANIMIANSDNSATNMILYRIGGIDQFNRSMRNLGFHNVTMGQWLPDLEGTNTITAYEISKILYNIDNPAYVNQAYKNILKEYLGNTRNIHLIKEKLPPDVMVFHKTGDIGEMLGDSGIVYTNNGKKYIVTILVKRPKNAYSAKTLIQDASKIIYDDIVNLK